MDLKSTSLAERRHALEDFVEALFADQKHLIDSVVADGWPAAMVEHGFGLHRATWEPEEVCRAVDQELSSFGGLAALDAPENPRRVIPPEVISHLWPALPGAGLTPVLFGHLLGIHQLLRPSSRGRHFAQHLVEIWSQTIGESLCLVDEQWSRADVVIVSGTDQTVDDVRSEVASRHGRAARVVGYGHRVSFSVIDDDDHDLHDLATAFADDIVLWHQTGCFSCRAVFFRGEEARLRRFCALLAEAIQLREETLDAQQVDSAAWASRAQRRGVAEFQGEVWGEGLGWVSIDRQPWTGSNPSMHAVTVHPLDGPELLDELVSVPSHHLQGAALAAGRRQSRWHDTLLRLGVTRICAPGHLQKPPASWPHDGRANVLDWLRIALVE